MKRFILGTLCVVALGCTTSTPTADSNSSGDGTSQTVDRDNSAVNVRDRSSMAKTPLDQNENQADIDITAKIRAKVVDTDMSFNAQNVKIITTNGQVTLRGPVDSAEEKKVIGEIVESIVHAKSVDNQLDVPGTPTRN